MIMNLKFRQKISSPALKSLDSEGRVIYVGSFQNLFSQDFVWVILLDQNLSSAKQELSGQVYLGIRQDTFRERSPFLRLGHYDALINRMAKQYSIRRSIMATPLKNTI